YIFLLATLPPPYPSLYSLPTRRSSDLSEYILALDRPSPSSCNVAGTIPSIPTRSGWNLIPPKSFASSPPACRTAGVSLAVTIPRSEEHTSELQSRFDLVCRLLLEKKN